MTLHYVTLHYIHDWPPWTCDMPKPNHRTAHDSQTCWTLHMICNSLKRNRIPWGRKCREPFLQINLLQRLSEGIDMSWGVEPSEVEPPGWYGAISMPFGNRCGICGGICGICGIAFLKTPGAMAAWFYFDAVASSPSLQLDSNGPEEGRPRPMRFQDFPND